MCKEKINEILDIFIDRFSILSNLKETDDARKQKRDLAFELLSCITIFKVSPYYAIEECWNAIEKDGIYLNDGEDGKIDGFFVVGDNDKIIVSLVQAKNTNKILQKDIELYI